MVTQLSLQIDGPWEVPFRMIAGGFHLVTAQALPCLLTKS
jgi:hypothetical protein